MDMSKRSKEKKKNLILKTWERCRSIGRGGRRFSGVDISPNFRSKSWPISPFSPDAEDKHRSRRRVQPEGCFSVYVGPQKQRFVIKTDCINHPLFRILLEEAESEYGHHCQGPILLPCDVDIFYKVLSEMDGDDVHRGCNFAGKFQSSYQLLSPSRLVTVDPLVIK